MTNEEHAFAAQRDSLIRSNEELRETIHKRTAIMAGFMFATLWFVGAWGIARRDANELQDIALAFGCASYHPMEGPIQYHASDEAPQFRGDYSGKTKDQD
jgi:hypothetical protein